MRARALVLAAAAAAGMTGCGNGYDETAVRQVVGRFYDAVRHEDGQGACALMSLAAAQQLESQSEQECREVVTRLDYAGGAITGVEVYLDNAKVDLRNGESAFLDKEPSGWRLTALACAPSPKPADQPYDCEVAS